MKKIIILLIATVSYFNMSAQGNANDISLIAQSLDQTKMNKKDCVMMKNGKMLMMKDGKTMDMTGDIKLNSGEVVSTNGSVKMKDGSTKMIKNGDCVDMNGNWERMDKPELEDKK